MARRRTTQGDSGSSTRRSVRTTGANRTSSRSQRSTTTRTSSRPLPYKAIPGGRYSDVDDATISAVDDFGLQEEGYTSTRVGDLRRGAREQRLRKSRRRHLIRVVVAIVIFGALAIGGVVAYNSDLFKIENVIVKGVEHLTSDEMAQIANVPSDTTLLRVDTDTIAARVRQNAWVQDVKVNRIWPDTLEIEVTERTVAAIVEVPNASGSSVKSWAIASDHVWLMPIPDKDSDAAKTTSAKIYEDADAALHITDVPYGTVAEIGTVCVDSNVNNALDIVSGLTTDLADHVAKVSASGPIATTLMLDNGVEVAFGKAEYIRDKERVILAILEENPDSVIYINVRMVEKPTWRSI